MKFKPRSRRVRVLSLVSLGVLAVSLSNCSSGPPMPTVQSVDLDRFMGRWYVVAHIPTSLEAEAYDATETYSKTESGEIDIRFRFREGSHEAEEQEHQFSARVEDDESSAVWGVQPFWPLRLEYRVIYLDKTYETTIIGRTRRDYAWIMTRDPRVPDARLEALVDKLSENGYELDALRRIPHQTSSN
ncbi:MAG: lipocalin family protein [Planctomycetota bacterium]